MKGETKQVRASELVRDFNLYPRNTASSQHVADLAESLRAGETLPPVVVERTTLRIVDGFHRVRAHQVVSGEDARVPAVMKDYETEGDLFLDAVRLNAGHGQRMSHYDFARCAQIAGRLHIDTTCLAKSLNITTEKLGKLMVTKVAQTPGGQLQPIRRSLAHLAGEQLSKNQQRAVSQMGGMSLLHCVNQLIIAIEHDCWPKQDKRLNEQVERFVRDWTKRYGKQSNAA